MRLERRWRTLTTGLCFVIYGSLGWLTGLIVLPLLLVSSRRPAVRRRRIRAYVGWSFRALLRLITVLGVGSHSMQGAARLRAARGQLIVANHPMYLDAIAILAQVPQTTCVAKPAMWRNPWYRRFVRAIGYLGHGAHDNLVAGGLAELKAGRNVLVFPEGTRSTPGQMRFQRGAAQLAVRAGCDIVPVVITCTPLSFGKGQAWHDIPARPWHLHLRVGAPLALAQLDARPDMPHGVAARHVNRALEAWFARELGMVETAAPAAHPPAMPREADAHA
ncbi:MAG TPA: lysophospholipid acyltransferase family protein [Rhodanobacteraceae bacterium]